MPGTVTYEVNKPTNGNQIQLDDSNDDECCKNLGKSSIFIVTCALLILGGFIIAILMGTIPLGTTDTSCMSHQCVLAAAYILDFIDESVDPCENFHKFSCGKFMEDAYAKHTTTPWATDLKRIKQELNAMILEPPREDDSHIVKMQKYFFRSCIDLDTIDEDEGKTFSNLLDQIGGWPVLRGQNWNEAEYDWLSMMLQSKRLGLPFEWFLNIGVRRNGWDLLLITAPEECRRQDKTKSYLNMMVDIAVLMNGSRTTAQSELRKVEQFEVELMKICQKAKGENITLATIRNLEILLPKVDWFNFLLNISETRTMNFTRDGNVYHSVSGYILDLDRLLIKTPKRVQANYFVWKTVENFLPYLNKQLRHYHQSTNRVEFCINNTKSRFPFVSEIGYIRKYVDALTRDAVKEMTGLLKVELMAKIERTIWMDQVSKEISTVRMGLIQEWIGGHDEMFDELAFDRYLLIGELNFTSDNIIEMLTEKSKAYHDKIFAGIFTRNKFAQNELLYSSDVTMYAYFYYFYNAIMLPAPVLHGFLFNLENPWFLNYAGLGVVVGHELVHSLGNIANTIKPAGLIGLWSNQSIAGFKEASQCLVDDYENFKADELETNLNGTLTLEENYADAVGRDVAYEAYQNWVKKNAQELKLPGLPYTPNQLFWIRSTMTWCHRSIIDLPADIYGDSVDKKYPISRYRNIGPLRNSQYFARDFHCAVGSYMNPSTKCHIL